MRGDGGQQNEWKPHKEPRYRVEHGCLLHFRKVIDKYSSSTKKFNNGNENLIEGSAPQAQERRAAPRQMLTIMPIVRVAIAAPLFPPRGPDPWGNRSERIYAAREALR